MADPYVTDQELLKIVQAARLPGDVAVRLSRLLSASGSVGPTGPAGPTGATGATGAAGAGFADGDYGDITISGSVTALTIDNDVVTNAKMANMADSTIKGRAVGAGTGDPTDLTGAQAAAIIGAVTSGGIPYFFASSHDGSVTFDGSTTILGMAPSGNVYTMTRDIYPLNMTVDSGVSVYTNGFRIFAGGTLTNNGSINDNGKNASGATQGGQRATSFYTQPGTGAAGTNGANGGAGGNTTGSPVFPTVATSTTGLGGAVGGNGTAGPVPFRGGGGGGASATRTGGTAGTITVQTANSGGPNLMSVIRGIGDNGATRYALGSGGGSGGGPASGSSGGGGGGAGLCFVMARTIAGSGAFEAKGGSGGNATGSGGGGGGGGGGGLVYLAYGTRTGSTTTSVTGGAAGTGSGGGGNGGAGADGIAVLLNLSGDGT